MDTTSTRDNVSLGSKNLKKDNSESALVQRSYEHTLENPLSRDRYVEIHRNNSPSKQMLSAKRRAEKYLVADHMEARMPQRDMQVDGILNRHGLSDKRNYKQGSNL